LHSDFANDGWTAAATGLDLPPNDLTPGRIVAVKPGELLVCEGELSDRAYQVLEGKVRVWKISSASAGCVELAQLGPGQIFGEMALVDEKPRSASVTALTEARLKVLRRSEFLQSFHSDPDFAAALLSALTERLREASARLALLPSPAVADVAVGLRPQSMPERIDLEASVEPLPAYTLMLEGLTEPAKQALPSNPFAVSSFPARLGRVTLDEFSNNDIQLVDFEPYQISINHLLIFQNQLPGENFGKIGLLDRGSSLGSWLNDFSLSQATSDGECQYISSGQDALLVLGPPDSFYRFRLTLQAVQ